MSSSLSFVCIFIASVSGLRWPGARETISATATASWTPAPTVPSTIDQKLLGRDLYPVSLCGWQGPGYVGAYCSSDSSCAWFTDYKVVGCCKTGVGGSCDAVYTSCIDGNHAPQSVSYPGVFTCTSTDVCYRNSFDSGYYQYGCGKSSIGQKVVTSWTGINTQFSILIAYTGGVLDRQVPVTLLAPSIELYTSTSVVSIFMLSSGSVQSAAPSSSTVRSSSPAAIPTVTAPSSSTPLPPLSTSSAKKSSLTSSLAKQSSSSTSTSSSSSSTSSSTSSRSSTSNSSSSSSTSTTSATTSATSIAATTTPSPSPSPHGLSKSSIIAIAVVCSILGLIALIALILCITLKRRKHPPPPPMHTDPFPDPTLPATSSPGFLGGMGGMFKRNSAPKAQPETHQNLYLRPGEEYPPPSIGGYGNVPELGGRRNEREAYGAYAPVPQQERVLLDARNGMGMGGGMGGMGGGSGMGSERDSTLRPEDASARWESMSDAPTMMNYNQHNVHELPSPGGR